MRYLPTKVINLKALVLINTKVGMREYFYITEEIFSAYNQLVEPVIGFCQRE